VSAENTNLARPENEPATPATLSPSPRELWRERWEFLWAFLRAPGRVGAVWPSSPALTREMLAGCRLDQARLVVELGPGTGVFTREILRAAGARTRIVALELDARAVARLRRNFPRVEVHHDSAEAILRYVARTGLAYADCVISGLPWASMPAALQERIMHNVAAALGPGGVFTTFAYLHARGTPAGRRYRRLLETLFGEVRVSRAVWSNLPPAVVYRCVKPADNAGM